MSWLSASWLSPVLVPDMRGAIRLGAIAVSAPFDAWITDPRPWTFGEFLLWLSDGREPA